MEEADVAATAMRAAEKQAAKEARERAAMQKCEAEVWAVAAMIARELTAMEIADDEAVRAEEWAAKDGDRVYVDRFACVMCHWLDDCVHGPDGPDGPWVNKIFLPTGT